MFQREVLDIMNGRMYVHIYLEKYQYQLGQKQIMYLLYSHRAAYNTGCPKIYHKFVLHLILYRFADAVHICDKFFFPYDVKLQCMVTATK